MIQEVTRLKKMARSAVMVVLVLLMVFTAVSCRGKNPIQSGNVEQTATLEDLNVRGSITLTINNESGQESEAMAPRAVAQAFMTEYPDTIVNVEEVNRGTYPQHISAGDIGDVFWCDEGDANNYMRTHNALMPLDAYILPLGIDLTDVYSGALDCGRINGRIYMAPRKLGEQVLVYNKDALAAGGIQIDNTTAMAWDDFATICKSLTLDSDGDGAYEQVGASLKVWWGPVWQMFFRGYSTTDWVDTTNKTISLTSNADILRGIETMFNAIREGWLYPEDLPNMGEVSSMYSNIPSGNANISSVVFKTFGSITWLTSIGSMYDQLAIDFDFCPFPAFPNHTISTGATGYVVYNRTANPDTAAAFALFFLTEEGQRAYHSQTGGNVPLLKSLADESFWKARGTVWEAKNFSAFIMYPEATRPATVITQLPSEIADIFSDLRMQSAIGEVLQGRADVQTVFTRMQTQANQLWETIMDD